MTVQQTIPFEEGTFFITSTCHKWMNLIETTCSFDLVYKWMDHLKSKGHKIIGYVIMPNPVHVLIDFIKTHQ
jgi:REP element-mobilizing transposase RayT